MVIYGKDALRRPKSIARLARQLGVSVEALVAMHIGWSMQYSSWAIPMCDDRGGIIGISLRRRDGTKWAVRIRARITCSFGTAVILSAAKNLAVIAGEILRCAQDDDKENGQVVSARILSGSTAGLFIPCNIEGTKRLLVCEGASDVAAIWNLGFQVIGRPGCNQAVRFVVRFVKRHRPRSVVVAADQDRPGLEGAKRLASALALHCAEVRIITPPKGITDVREWVRLGLTARKLRATIRSAPPVKVTISLKGEQA